MEVADGDVVPTNQQQVNQQAPQQPQPLGAQGRPGFFRSLLASLLTGVQAGVMAPQSAQGPSDAAQIANALPQQRIQQQQQQEEYKTRQQLEQGQVALQHVQILQSQLLINKLSNEAAYDLIDSGIQHVERLQEQGTGRIDFQSDTKKAVDDYVLNQIRGGDANVKSIPISRNGGKITWGAVRSFPKNTIQEPQDITIPGRKFEDHPELDVPDRTHHFDIGTPQHTIDMWQSTNTRDVAAQSHTSEQQWATLVKGSQQSALQQDRDSLTKWKTLVTEQGKDRRAQAALSRKGSDDFQKAYKQLLDANDKLSAIQEKPGFFSELTGRASADAQPAIEAVNEAKARVVTLAASEGIAVDTATGLIKGAVPRGGGGKIRVKIGNQTGTIDEKDFDDKTMVKVP